MTAPATACAPATVSNASPSKMALRAAQATNKPQTEPGMSSVRCVLNSESVSSDSALVELACEGQSAP
jgi:hypothetical protein